jgi:DNA-binding NarL/FixJ family response regulator
MSDRTRTQIRIAIVQHEALYRDLLGVALRSSAGIEVVGTFANGGELLRMAADLAPQVTVLDLDPAGNNGVPLALRLRRVLPDLGFVLLVDQRDATLLSSVSPENVLSWLYVVNKTTHGLSTLQRAIQVTHARLFDLEGIESDLPPPLPALPDITDRQRAILDLLVQGLSNQAIARSLDVKEKSIENQLATIYAKLHPGADRALVHQRVWVALRYARVMASKDEATAS